MKLGPKQKKWIAYLKKHPEQQTDGTLGEIIKRKKKMCCLGAAGIILGSCRWNNGQLYERFSDAAGTLDISFVDIGLFSPFGGTSDNATALSTINDDGDNSWIDIAYMLENAPELFFNKSV